MQHETEGQKSFTEPVAIRAHNRWLELEYEKEMFRAINDHDADQALKLLGTVNKEATDDIGANLLHALIKAGRESYMLIPIFISAGVEVDARDYEYRTPLIYAMMKKDAQAARELLKDYADPNLTDANGNSPLFFATSKAQVQALIQAGVYLATTNNDGDNALHYLLRNKRPAAAEEIISTSKSTLRMRSREGETSLHIAARLGYHEIVDRIMQHDGEPYHLCQMINLRQETPLMVAVRHNRSRAALSLLPYSQSTDRDYLGNTVLHMIAESNEVSLFTRIAAKSVSLNVQNLCNETPLMSACKFNHPKAIRRFLAVNASLECTNAAGLKPFHVAVFFNAAAAVEELLEIGVNINQVDANLRTAMHYAVETAIKFNSYDIIRILISHGADFTIPDKNGDTVDSILHRPLFVGIKDAVQFIIMDASGELREMKRRRQPRHESPESWSSFSIVTSEDGSSNESYPETDPNEENKENNNRLANI